MPTEKPEPHHLIICIHGMSGSESSWPAWEKAILSFKISNLKTFVPKSNFHGKSKDGIAVAGTRLADEIMKHLVSTYKKGDIIHLTMLSHSFGGISSRYAIGLLFGEEKYIEQLKMFEIKPNTYCSMASPHLGVRKTIQKSVTRGVVKFSVETFLKAKGYGETGRELILKDKENIMQEMSKWDSKFIKGLMLFDHRVLVGLAHFDFSVPFPSSLICNNNPFKKPVDNDFNFEVKGVYNFPKDHIVYSLVKEHKDVHHDEKELHSYKKCNSKKKGDGKEDDFLDNENLVKYSMKHYEALQKVDWRRICIQFTTKTMPLVHPLHYFYKKKTPSLKRKMPFLSKKNSPKEIAIEKACDKFITFLKNILVFNHGLLLID